MGAHAGLPTATLPTRITVSTDEGVITLDVEPLLGVQEQVEEYHREMTKLRESPKQSV